MACLAAAWALHNDPSGKFDVTVFEKVYNFLQNTIIWLTNLFPGERLRARWVLLYSPRR